MSDSQYVLRPRVPVRVVALQAAAAVVAAFAFIAPSAFGWPGWWLWIGVFFAVVVLALGALTAWSIRQQTVRISLDDRGYRVEASSGDREGSWEAITAVTAAPGRLTLHAGDESRMHFMIPPSASAQMEEVAADITHRLDADRGYRPFEG